ncbi:dCTP deaminase [Terriglobus albidus]|uniref:dCTP deaminase n=1 Tax=Terriglobus albidus TaxID=1592106 RepID=UPI0021E0B6C6|nr:hypothetical protein [Terriglobus albidus]
MFLSRERIAERFQNSPLFSENTGDPKHIQQASYDLRLGAASYVVGADVPVKLSADKQEYLTIAPGQFALLTTHEILSMPRDLLGFITLKNSFKMQGLINVSGFHVDPTFKGRLVFAVNNIGPSDIRLRYGEATFTIFFSTVDGDIGEARSPVREDLPLSYVQLLGGSSLTLSKVQKDLDDLKFKFLFYAPLGVGLLVALILNLLKK